MKNMKLLVIMASAMLTWFGFAAAIENVIALQRPGTGIVDIYYDLIINEGGTTIVSASVEGGDGVVKMQTLSGDIGHVAPGPARHIVWDAQADNPECVISDLRVAISASVMDVVENPGMRKISGTYHLTHVTLSSERNFTSSRNWEKDVWEGEYNCEPFYIDRAPVSGILWNKVAAWAVKHGFAFEHTYSSSASVVYVSENDAWIWCNARSAMEGLPLCHRRNTWGEYSYTDRTEEILPERNGGYRLPFYEEMQAAFCAGISGIRGYAVWWQTGSWNIGRLWKVNDPSVDIVIVPPAFTWEKYPFYCVRDEKPRYSIAETFPPNYSRAFTIDTRINSPTFPKDFKIIDVKSKYCDGKYGKGRKALFLSGVSCNVEFEAEVSGGELAYLERVDNEDAPAVGEQISWEDGKFSLNVGALTVGDPFVVRAHSVDGRCSQAFRLNFDIASRHRGVLWKAVVDKNSILYRTAEWDSFRIFDQLGPDQPENPIANKTSNFLENLVGNFSDYPHKLAVGFNVCWTMDSSDGVIRGVTMVGGQTTANVDDILNDQIRNASKTLKFGSVSGYVKAGIEQTWSWDTRALEWKGNGNYLAFNAGANGCFAAGWAYGFYYTADGGLDLYLRARLANGGLEYMVDTDNLLYLTLRVGWGIPSVASLIEGSGTASMFLTYDTESDPELQRLGVALALALRSHALGFVVPIWDWKGEWYWFGGENKPIDFDLNEIVDEAMSSAITNANSSTDNLVTRDYLDNQAGTGGTGSGYGGPGTPPVTTNSYPTSYTPVKICDNGMPGPTPQASGDTPPTTTGGGSGGGPGGTPPNNPSPTKIVTVTDNPNRSSRTRAMIITISDMTNTTFTAEDAVWDDGTPDYHPTIARMTNGCSVVAWMNEREGKPENISLGEMMSAMEIAVAVWDDAVGEWSHLNLTDNSAYDRSPVLKTATNGTAAVAWLRNTYTNYIGSAAKPNQICFARYAEGSWTAETVVVPSVGRVRKLDMAYDGNRAAIVFNEEDDPGVGTTQRLYVVTGNCTTWEQPRVLAVFPVNNSAAYAYYDESGGLRLVWNDEGTIKTGCYANGTFIAETIDTDGHHIPGDYVFTRAHSGRMALVWLEPMREGDSAMGPVSMTYNPACGMWTLPCALTSDGKNKTEVSAAFNDSGDLEVFYATPNVVTNEQGVVETVSSGFSKVTRRHGGDAAMLVSDFSFSTNVFTEGCTVDIFFKLKNLGDECISNFYCCVNGNTGVVIDGVREIAISNLLCIVGLEDGQTLTFNHLWPRVSIRELKVRQCLEMKVQWKVSDIFSEKIQGISFGLTNIPSDIDTRNNGVNWSDICDIGADVALVQAQSRIDERSRNVRHVSVSLENNGLAAVPTGTEVTFRRGSAQGALLAKKTVGKVLAGDDGVQTTGFAWDISSIAPTSDVEVVHVTAELPESNVVSKRTLETGISVDVSPIVKSPLTAYTLEYDANGGEGTMAAEQPFYDEWGTLASNSFTRAGYSFTGWALSPTGDVVYADGAVRWNVPMFTRDTATLYAVWVRCAEETSTTAVPVPFDWLGLYFPEATNGIASMDGRIANFEAIANRQTGKRDGSGRVLTVTDDYIMGTNPTNLNDVFTAGIEIVDNIPLVTWTPNLNTNGEIRVYTVLGKTNLTDSVEWAPTNSAHRFFKVTVEMP